MRRMFCVRSGSYPGGTVTSIARRSVVSRRVIYLLLWHTYRNTAFNDALAGQHHASGDILSSQAQRTAGSDAAIR